MGPWSIGHSKYILVVLGRAVSSLRTPLCSAMHYAASQPSPSSQNLPPVSISVLMTGMPPNRFLDQLALLLEPARLPDAFRKNSFLGSWWI